MKVLYSCAVGHFVQVAVQVLRGATKADESLKHVSYKNTPFTFRFVKLFLQSFHLLGKKSHTLQFLSALDNSS